MAYSILIPVYNTNITKLVEGLLDNAFTFSEPFEIYLIDDCSELSSSYINKKVALLENVQYEVLTENIGRSKIRNKLIQQASYDKCIFIDGDMQLTEANGAFIQNYLKALDKTDVVVGGHHYAPSPPSDEKLFLHWRYGIEIEVQNAIERNDKPYARFMTGNFACTKAVFESIYFDENIQGYGHEDTLFGIELEKAGIPIKHIDNALLHDGLVSDEVFLSKQEKAAENLKKIYLNSSDKKAMRKVSKLIPYATNPIFKLISKLLYKSAVKNLKSNSPKLRMLQWAKIYWFSQAKV